MDRLSRLLLVVLCGECPRRAPGTGCEGMEVPPRPRGAAARCAWLSRPFQVTPKRSNPAAPRAGRGAELAGPPRAHPHVASGGLVATGGCGRHHPGASPGSRGAQGRCAPLRGLQRICAFASAALCPASPGVTTHVIACKVFFFRPTALVLPPCSNVTSVVTALISAPLSQLLAALAALLLPTRPVSLPSLVQAGPIYLPNSSSDLPSLYHG